MKKMKAFIFSLDVLAALALLGTVMIAVFAGSSAPSPSDSLYLRSFGNSMLSSFERSGALSKGVDDPTTLRVLLNGLPQNLCGEIALIDSAGDTVRSLRTGQGCDTRGNFYTSYRSFYSNGALYTAKAEVWVR